MNNADPEKSNDMLKKVFYFSVFLVALLCLCTSCGRNEDIPISRNPEMTDFILPVELQKDSTVVELSDFFRHPRSIDSLFIHKGIRYKFSEDSLRLTFYVQEKTIPRLIPVKFWADGFPYWILLRKTEKIWHHFEFDPGDKTYKTVWITGEMNAWTPGVNLLSLKDGKWQTDLYLRPGRYEYQLILDGKMMPDPSNPDKTENLYGGWNSFFKAGNITHPGAPYLYTFRSSRDQISVGIRNKTTDIFVFWGNHLLDSIFWRPDSTGISIRIPNKAKDFDRSFIHVIACNNQGVSNQVLVPVTEGKVLTDPGDLTRHDHETMIMYSLVTDRFFNGNLNNDFPIQDSLLDKKLNFQGGDFTGILKKIEENYFGALGINSIWISPVTQSPSMAWPDFTQGYRKSAGYHGYWPVSTSTIEKRFGSADDLNSLVEEAHSKDLNVIIDLVSNRVHKESVLFGQHPEWFTPLSLENRKKNVRLWKEQPYTTWFEDFLPTFDLSNPEVSAMMTDSAIYWIKAFEIDGFRHDAVNHVREAYWRTLTRKLKENVVIPDKRPVFQIGEYYGTRGQISDYHTPGIMDALFDINLYLSAARTFAMDNASFRDLSFSLRESMNLYGDHSLMGNISGANDLPRFISYAAGAISPGEDYVRAGWERNIRITDSIPYKKLALLHAFNMTIPGIPVIYYGDEIGLPGAGEPDNRRMMRFDSLTDDEQRLKQTVESLARFRKTSMPLLYGDFIPVLVTDKVMVYMRNYFEKVVFVVFNKNYTTEDITFEIPEPFAKAKLTPRFGGSIVTKGNMMTVTLRGNTFTVLSN